MTHQTSDKFLYEGNEYELVGISKGSDLFDIASFRITTTSYNTANYRGRLCRFTIVDDELVLKDLAVMTDQNLPINNIFPRKLSIREQLANYSGYFAEFGSIFLHGDNYYLDVNLPVIYTGKLLIATDFISRYQINGGFDSPLKFEKVILLIVEEGIVLDVVNVSNVIKAKRERMIRTGIDIKWIFGNLTDNSEIFRLF
ncbi:hypothetical protein [uncultured Ligilactobacillus sp.]|uniref:hypothetical protein n=1 Tax=uncultured Ligilactobacillus sp. TaxID=2837633 RepID=UPI00272D439B|nr:hypothetical protein [uncultured Ligilactobacillus sp.]